jgi:MFS family permease
MGALSHAPSSGAHSSARPNARDVESTLFDALNHDDHFQCLSDSGFYGFLNWVPTLLIKQGITITNSLFYTTLIALTAPVGPLLGLLIADRFERKHVLVVVSLAIIVCGLAFSQVRGAMAIVSSDANPEDYDPLLLPGGQMNPGSLRIDKAAIQFIRSMAEEGKPIAAICHGPTLLIEAVLSRPVVAIFFG